MNLNILKSLGKAKLPKTGEISKIPSEIKTAWQNTDLNTINVRFFNTGFSKVIRTVGHIDRSLAIPIIYIEKPLKGGIIMLDDTSYTDVTDGETYIDVCESYPFTLDPKNDIKFDFDAQYYNDISRGFIDKKDGDKLKASGGTGYYIPVLLKNIPIPIIVIEKNMSLPFLGLKNIKSKTFITQALLLQMSKSKMFARTTDPDNGGMGYAFLLGFILGGLIFSLLTIYLFTG